VGALTTDIAAEWLSDAGVRAYPPLFIGKFAHVMRIGATQ
jgi:hypothetical protein